VKTELEALLGLFEQQYFIDEEGHIKKYTQPIENENIRRMAETLSYVAASEEGRREMDAEESVRRIVEGDFNEEMQKVRSELMQKNQALAEKDNALAEKDNTIAEKEKQIAELLAKLDARR
jgi:hypothetical protein